MSWLKKLGTIAVAVGKTAPIAGPILSAVIPGSKDDPIIAKTVGVIDPIAKIIGDVEKMGTALALTGPQKLTAATALVKAALEPYAARLGVEDPSLVTKGAGEIAQGVVDFMNGLKAPTV